MSTLYRHNLSLILLILTLGLAAEAAMAQSGVIRPQRLVHQFDFNERDMGNFEPMPMHWYPIGRPAQTSEPSFHRQPLHRDMAERLGYPRHTELRFDGRHALRGEQSFYMGLDGGNAGAYLEVGTLPAVPGSDYLVVGHVRTAHVNRSGARLTAYFVDADGERIDASVRRSEPVRSNDRWRAVAVNLPGEFDEAAWIGMELELLQPAPDPDHPLRRQQIVLQDIKAAAWFDDISIWQIPHLEVATQSPVNLVSGSQTPRITATVRDLTGRRLSAELVVYDHGGEVVDRREYTVGDGAPPRWGWEPDLPRHGWYLVDMIVRDEESPAQGGSPVDRNEPIARTMGAFAWLPSEPPKDHADASRFSLLAEDMPERQLRLLPDVLNATDMRRAVVSVWDRDTTRHTIDDRVEMLDELVQRLAPDQQDLAMSLYPLPDELVEQSDRQLTRPLELFREQPDAWLAYLTPVLLRHGPRVRRWHVGSAAEATAFFEPALPRLIADLEQQFLALAPRPRLVLPWSLEQSRRGDVSDGTGYTIDVSPGIVAEHLPDHLDAWSEGGEPGWLALRSSPADRVPHERRVIDLALRMVYAWQQDPAGLALPRPWTGAAERRAAILPDPLLAVFSNVANRLTGRRVIGELPAGEGLRVLIMDGPSGGMLVAWNHNAPDGAALDLYLGESPVALDVWGNREAVSRGDGRHHVALGREPVFIEGIDPELAMFRASFRVDPPFIESLQVPHERTITLTNPWSRTISGHMQMIGPKGWRLAPARHHFSIAAGQTVTLPLELQFPIVEVAGPKRLTARFDFTADQQYTVEMSAPMRLGLSNVDFDATLALEPGDDAGTQDAVVACLITNTGEEATAIYVFANLRGHPRQERIVARLDPGESVVRRFRFRDAGNALEAGLPIRTGVRETNGPAMLNNLLTLDEID
ncbi:MAG: hypothetical protein WD118_05500 [Phycisphaeraceae bacterium]